MFDKLYVPSKQIPVAESCNLSCRSRAGNYCFIIRP